MSYKNDTAQNSMSEAPSAHSPATCSIEPEVLSKHAPPRSPVALGHITAAEIARAKQVRADLDAELGITRHNQEATSHPQLQKTANSSRGRPKKEVIKLPHTQFDAMLEKVCYENSTQKFWKQNAAGAWISLSGRDLERHLKHSGLASDPADGDSTSQVDDFVVRVQNENYVHMRADIGGYRKGIATFGDTRILIPNEPKFITPVPGDWSMLSNVLVNMFGHDQLPYIYGWIKMTLAMLLGQSWMPGQVLALCGEKEAGKNLFADLLRYLFGGRMPGKPFSYMTQGTQFNSDFVGAELLTIEDEVSLTTIQSRRAFGARLKDTAVNNYQRLHRKNAEAIVVIPLQRLVISLNDEHERMRVLPPLDADIEDKIMLMKVFRHPMPMPTMTPVQRKLFNDSLIAQLPAFMSYLNGWAIPDELVSNRFGIKHFHHPDLVSALQESDPEQNLLDLIDEVLFYPGSFSEPWRGLTNDLIKTLNKGGAHQGVKNIGESLKDITQCGMYLGRLASKRPDRVQKVAMNSGSQKWTIGPPENHIDSSGHDDGRGYGKFQKQRTDVDALREKLRQRQMQVLPTSGNGESEEVPSHAIQPTVHVASAYSSPVTGVPGHIIEPTEASQPAVGFGGAGNIELDFTYHQEEALSREGFQAA